jgi:S-DNA-T family DNA segregation ATPase FtsK/SpoIIIE
MPAKTPQRPKNVRTREKGAPEKAPQPSRRVSNTPPRTREFSGLALGALSLAALLGLLSFTHATNWAGPVGRVLADLLLGFLGIGAYPLVFGLLGLSVLWLLNRSLSPRLVVVLSLSGVFLSALVLLSLFGPSAIQKHPPAGRIGSGLAGQLVALFSVPGSTVLALAALLGSLAVFADFELRRLVEWLGRSGRFLAAPVVAGVEAAQEVWREAKEAHEYSRAESAAQREERRKRRLESLYEDEPEDEDEIDESADEEPAPLLPPSAAEANKRLAKRPENTHSAATPAPIIKTREVPKVEEAPKEEPKKLRTKPEAPEVRPEKLSAKQGTPDPAPEKLHEPPVDGAALLSMLSPKTASAATSAAVLSTAPTALLTAPIAAATLPAAALATPPTPALSPEESDDLPEPSRQAPAQSSKKPSPKAKEEPAPKPAATTLPKTTGPTIVEPMQRPKPFIPEDNPKQPALDPKDYQLPPLGFLDYQPPTGHALDRVVLTGNARKLEQKLLDYHVPGNVMEIHPGPVITMYEFSPAPGIKISKIASLSDDLAMALEAERVRIIAPIPGKSVVGIEIPNLTRETVYLKEILADAAFQKSGSKLALGIGKDVSGAPKVADLAKMPHLLVAGATGSGKSVAINTFICSILFNASPQEVRFIMVDPKMLELSIYEGIPHLLLPVVTDMKKAALALRWAVDEMERRYQLLAEAGVRNIANYNKKIELKQQEQESRKQARRDAAMREDLPAPGSLEEAEQSLDAQELEAPFPDAKIPDPLPYIVVIIDELADLMMVASREVETSIARLAQMARAAGIHLILATQRPSVDVITGLIKANFPSRISFQVASKIDSRTILDQQGSENLLGMGDMLMMERGKVQRFHGALVLEEEIHQIVDFLKQQGTPQYDESILAPRDDEEGGERDEDEAKDALYDQALAMVAEMEKVSTSMLQRKMRIGYNRAARLIEIMEKQGVVGPGDGAKPREVLIRPI